MLKLYKGSFNFHNEIHQFYRKAYSSSQAFFYMTRKLSQKLNVTHSLIKYYFGGMRDNYKITEEK